MDRRFLIVDSHEDMAENILTFGRDYTRSVAETRRLEKTTITPERNGDTLLGWDAYMEGGVAIVFSTLFAAPERCKLGDWDLLCYANRDEAYCLYLEQVTVYQELVQKHPDKFQLILSKPHLQNHLEVWKRALLEDHTNPKAVNPPLGLVLLIEGGEGIRHPDELDAWWDLGVRIIGPAWAGTCFSGGTNEPGPLTSEGYDLIEKMAEIGFALDISHMDEWAALQAIDFFQEKIIASHSNARVLLSEEGSNRLLSDQVILSLFKKGGLIGVVPYNGFLKAGWKDGDARSSITLHHIVDQIDYLCQMAGNANQVGIGTDFDGGFGLQSTPQGINSIADLQKLAPLLSQRGYSQENIAAIFGENWIRRLFEFFPS